MEIAVGSTNPVKVDATEAAIAGLNEIEPAAVRPVSVDSGVSEQPRGVAETVEGARNRARAALGDGYDLSVGIEGGVATYDSVDGLFLVMWAGATDGDRLETAGGPSIRLPSVIERRVERGEELGPAMDDLLGEDDVAKRQGAAGAFTGGSVDRTDALRTAVAGAVGPLIVEHYDH